MAHECPSKKKQAFKPSQKPALDHWASRPNPSNFGTKPPFKKKSYEPNKGYRKFNQPRPAHIQSAMIEEVKEEEADNYAEEEDIPSLAVRTARLSEDQHEQWLSEMKDMGVKF